jgi:hypothetical protein
LTQILAFHISFGMLRPLVAAAVASFVGPVLADDSPDKSQYHLFNPTPRALMREMSADRPDKTESPFTVDAGHFQIESDLVAYAHDHDTAAGANLHGDSWDFATLNLKAGLCNFSDLQVMLFPYSRVRTNDRVAGTIGRQSGFGDVLTRLKVNLWGNDGGSSAGGLMPFVKWPTSQDNLGNRAIEAGVILPIAVELPGGFGLGAMTEFDWLQDAGSHDYHPEFVNSVTVTHKIVGELDGFVEFFSVVSEQNGADWIGTFDFGFTYGITDNMQLDAGAYVGVTKSAADIAPFVGFSIRF